MREFARDANLVGFSRFTAIGTLSSVVLGFFDPEAKQYARIPIHEQVEVLSLLGNVALHDGKPKVHAHVVVGKRDGTRMAATCSRPTSGPLWKSC